LCVISFLVKTFHGGNKAWQVATLSYPNRLATTPSMELVSSSGSVAEPMLDINLNQTVGKRELMVVFKT
jgi:hypothetical protein